MEGGLSIKKRSFIDNCTGLFMGQETSYRCQSVSNQRRFQSIAGGDDTAIIPYQLDGCIRHVTKSNNNNNNGSRDGQ